MTYAKEESTSILRVLSCPFKCPAPSFIYSLLTERYDHDVIYDGPDVKLGTSTDTTTTPP